MEEDIKAAKWIVAKVKTSDSYAQNLYAALCNMQWQRLDVMPILKDEYWHCSWRYAGGLVAEIRDCGEDYMDYYCSGIRNDNYQTDLDIPYGQGFVGEGQVTDEIRDDLFKLGWQPVPYNDDFV